MLGLISRTMLLTALLLPCAGLAQVKVKASYGSPSVSQVIFPLGVQAGIFQRQGLNVEAIYIAGRSIAALLAGDVQFGFMGGPQIVTARASGADLVVVAGNNRLGQMIVVHPSIKSPADLIGKKAGIGVFGTTSDYGMRLGLKQFNLRPHKDVTFIQVGDVPARVGALTSGAVHAASFSTYDKLYVDRFGLRILTETENIDFMGSAVATTESFAKTHRDTVQKFVRGIVETNRFIRAEPQKTMELLGKIYREKDGNAIEQRYKTLLEAHVEYPYVLPTSVQSIIEVLKEDGKIKDATGLQSVLDMGYLHAVEKERPGSPQNAPPSR
jgi:ABC-type nitrate/sulfonate/bicarbonate transport system substrate-binding protein